MAACAYGSASCKGRTFGQRGSREHLTCSRGYAAYIAAQPKTFAEAKRAQAASHEAFLARREARKVAEPVKPVLDVEALALALAPVIAAAVAKALK